MPISKPTSAVSASRSTTTTASHHTAMHAPVVAMRPPLPPSPRCSPDVTLALPSPPYPHPPPPHDRIISTPMPRATHERVSIVRSVMPSMAACMRWAWRTWHAMERREAGLLAMVDAWEAWHRFEDRLKDTMQKNDRDREAYDADSRDLLHLTSYARDTNNMIVHGKGDTDAAHVCGHEDIQKLTAHELRFRVLVHEDPAKSMGSSEGHHVERLSHGQVTTAVDGFRDNLIVKHYVLNRSVDSCLDKEFHRCIAASTGSRIHLGDITGSFPCDRSKYFKSLPIWALVLRVHHKLKVLTQMPPTPILSTLFVDLLKRITFSKNGRTYTIGRTNDFACASASFAAKYASLELCVLQSAAELQRQEEALRAPSNDKVVGTRVDKKGSRYNGAAVYRFENKPSKRKSPYYYVTDAGKRSVDPKDFVLLPS
jgi:hypothetical protein